jgi:serine/threonine protein kinase
VLKTYLEPPDHTLRQELDRETALHQKLRDMPCHADSCGIYRNTRGRVVVAYPACVEGPLLTLTLPELRTFGSQLLQTLAYLHERNIIHCDVQRAKVGWGYCTAGSYYKQV